MEYLEGGREGKIGLIDGKVHRPAGAWTPFTQALLKQVRAEGFLGVPEPFGFDEDGNEIVSYIVGEVSNYPLSEAAKSTAALISSAQLLRRYHDASVSFVKELKGNETWFMPARKPIEVICHGDYAPYNVVLEGDHAIAMIDFDVAHPGPRTWDIAYGLYRWGPLTSPKNADGFATEAEKITRCRLFCDAYGLDQDKRQGLIALVIERLQVLVDFMQAGADAGNEAFQANIADGHHLLYLGDIQYLRKNGERIQSGLME